MIIDTNNIDKARNLIKKSNHPIIIQAKDNKFNRKILEVGGFNAILGIEKIDSKNSLKNIDSGFNHVLAKIAKKNNISLAIDIKEIKKLDSHNKAIYLSKLIQNIKICRKNNVPIIILGESSKNSILSLMLSLKASSQQASYTSEKSISF